MPTHTQHDAPGPTRGLGGRPLDLFGSAALFNLVAGPALAGLTFANVEL